MVKGVYEGHQPLFLIPSPSPLRERGTKGVRVIYNMKAIFAIAPVI